MKYPAPVVVVDPAGWCRPCRILQLSAFHASLCLQNMMNHPADELSSCAGPRKPMGFLGPEPIDQ